MSRIMILAENEFSSTIRNPVVILSVALLMIISMVSAYGYTLNMFNNNPIPQDTMSLLSMFMTTIGGDSYEISFIFVILSVCLGIFSIAEERSGGALRVLISKPIYRRDIILGKFIGLGVFLLVAISFILVIRVSAALILHPMPVESFIEIFARITSLIVSIFLCCAVMLGISMMVGTVFKNIAIIITFVASIIYVEWYTPILEILYPVNILDPKLLSIYYSLGEQQDSTYIFTTCRRICPGFRVYFHTSFYWLSRS